MQIPATAATNPEIGTAAEHITTQFFVATVAAKALDHQTIWARAKAAGVVSHQWEANRHRMPPGKTLITARRTLVPFLIEYWVELAKSGRGDLDLVALAEAVKAALDSIDPNVKPRRA